MAKVCLRKKRNRRISAFVLPLALAAALVVSGCGAKTENNGGGTEAASGTSGQENGAGEEGKDSSGADGGTAAAADAAAEKKDADASAKKKDADASAKKKADETASGSGTGAAADAAGTKKDADASAKKKGDEAAAGSGTGAAADAAGTKKDADAAAKKGGKTGAGGAAGAAADAASGKTGAGTAAAGGTDKKAGTKDAITQKAEGGSADGKSGSGNPEEDKYAGFSDFTSSKMGFSFKYDPANKVKDTETGACEMVIGKEKNLTGLFVSSLSAEGMKEPSEILKEEAGDVNQKYKNSMVEGIEKSRFTVDDHNLTGQTWAYSLPSGGTVECASYIEVRGGRYIFFKTEAMRGDTAPADEALKLAIRTLKISREKGGTAGSDSSETASTEAAAKSSTSKKSKKSDGDSAGTVGISDLTGGEDEKEGKTEEFGGAYSFDIDEKWLVVPKDTSTTVYTRGSMQGAYFVVDKIELEEKPAKYLSNRAEEIKENLGARLIAEPSVRSVELGERKLTGIEYEYASADGARNLYQAEYIETTALGTFSWELACNQGDNESVAAMLSAMESFMPNVSAD